MFLFNLFFLVILFGIEYYYYDQLGSAFSDNPNDTSLWNLPRFVEEVETEDCSCPNPMDEDDEYEEESNPDQLCSII